jgi:ATP-dependent DNA helicase RecG
VEIQVFSSQGGFDSPDVPVPLRFDGRQVAPAQRKRLPLIRGRNLRVGSCASAPQNIVIGKMKNPRDRKFMELAIKEMLKSRGEHSTKVDPLVGAVLVGSRGRILGTAHRGNLRNGEHAEFTLLDKKLIGTDVAGSTLYVTLEPCTTRNPPKKPCAERVAAARVRRVVIGMLDPNPQIQGRGITYLQEKKVEVAFFHTDLAAKIREENKDFIETFSHAPAPIESKVAFAGPSSVESELVESASFIDLSKEALRAYLEARKRRMKIPSAELMGFLCKNGFLRGPSGQKKCPTAAGILLFGKNPEDFFVQSKVMLEAHSGSEVETQTITGPLTLMPLQIEGFFRKNLKTFTRIEGFKRVETLEVPLEALREAIMNALAHRDYRGGARVMVKIFDDKIVIRSPGLPLAPISLETIRKYDAPAWSRNPRIASAFADLNLMEERGWGLKKMRDLTIQIGLPAPRFDYDDGAFVVTFYRAKQESSSKRENLSKTLKSILNFAKRKKGRITNVAVAKTLKLNERTARHHLQHLEKLGLLEKRGSTRSVFYVLK